MAGDWIQYDACLPQKPEVIELVDRTGLEVEGGESEYRRFGAQ